jgi:alkylation response protein AidB-like acyl-CoA dehydrogenase
MEEVDPFIYLPLMITSGIPTLIYRMGTEEQKRAFISPLVAGNKIGCTAITEPDVGSNPSDVRTRAVLDGNYYVLNGTKTWITNGAFADIGLILVNLDPEKGPKGLNFLIVDKEVSPFETRPLSLLGDDRRIPTVGELVFTDCRVPRENLLGAAGEGLRETMIIFQSARCLVALNSVVFAQRALDAAISYAKQRIQFGRPIGQFQLIQDMIAEMAALTDAARLLTYRAATMAAKGVRCHKEASIAKFYATEAAVKVTSMAIQIHGAYGLSPEYPVERLFRGARVMTIPDGTTQIQKLIVARELLGMQAFI